MAPQPNFESMSFNSFLNNNTFIGSNRDPDVNFFLENLTSLNTEYCSPSDVKIGFSKFESPETFSVLYPNIRNLKKNFETSGNFIKSLI